MDTKNELWDRLANESERAYEAFQTFLGLPPGDRTLIGAYRVYVSNPDASKISDTWQTWCATFAWADRARAYDAHIERIRRRGMEQAIEEEARRQTRRAEQVRNHFHELLTAQYEAAMRWFEEVGHEGMRASDVVQIARLHLEHMDKFGAGEQSVTQDEWT